MTDTSAKQSVSKGFEIQYEGWSDATAKLVSKKNRMENVKEKILSSIKKNMDFYTTNGKTLSSTVRILKDAEDYMTVVLRCGTFPIWKNTVKKGAYKEMDILRDLENKLNNNFFNKEIEAYLNRKVKSSTKKSSSKSGKTKSKASSAE